MHPRKYGRKIHCQNAHDCGKHHYGAICGHEGWSQGKKERKSKKRENKWKTKKNKNKKKESIRFLGSLRETRVSRSSFVSWELENTNHLSP